MVNKDDRPSLLAKMAKFVRNPTKDWSELDQPEQPQDSGYDKQALKAMIERKRQNDFVRKREFEQLRKLRNKDPVAVAGMVRQSFFQTSTPAGSEAKASTLKKIDDIEAQMSKQWWKVKEDATAAQSLSQSLPQSRSTGAPLQHPNDDFSAPSSEQFRPTVVSSELQETLPSDQDSVITQMVTGTTPKVGATPDHAAASLDNVKQTEPIYQGFNSSALFDMSPEDLSSEPELDEAAIRFANRDDQGAEQGLLEALRGGDVTPQSGRPWIGALLDLYRATDKPVSFALAVEEFGAFLDNSSPEWSALSDAPAAIADYRDTEPGGHLGIQSAPIWACPQTLNADALETLRSVLAVNPMPWHLDWSELQRISLDALPLLDALFHSLCDEPVALRFSGSGALLGQLHDETPANDRDVESTWWQVRLAALRVMRLQDEFELAALHYCVTYGAAPVAWQDPQCVFEGLDSNDLGSSTGLGTSLGGSVQSLELRGDIFGDASQVLARLDAMADDGPIIVSCAALLRVDFAAAGNILNWAAVRQTQGRQVQFREVHRLVAAFFNVIGINEHARVLLRNV